MRKDFERIYSQLHYWGLVTNQFDFSTLWLGQCRSYFSSMKAREAEPGAEATLALLTRMRRHNEYLQQTDMPRTNTSMGQLSSMLEMEADRLFQQLNESILQRVARRCSNQLEEAS